MLFILISLVFLFIFFIALFGDYEEKKIKKEYKYMEEILDGDRKKH